ncbi:hypothetical protein Taro_018058 [Colocasia esculenta]|uniref:Putative plant transposon protein domain-containing protein n=1 Tax=Colocasia esculenta TaxID=4460 RepID=A0A843UPY8_COLES|nr:hypothetical protein [Colocasia esculenta]
MKGRFSSNFYINNSFTPIESTRLKSLFDSSVLIRSSRLPALRRRTFRSPLRNLILSRRRAQVSVQLTSDQLQRLAKIPICSGKSVEFSHLSGNLAWVEETLTAMGWTKLCQISEPFMASAVRSFYASLKVSTGNTVVGYLKGTKITISEEYLVELLDCPNSGHCLSEFIPLEKQKLGIIGSLGTLWKRGLQVNELSAEKRLIHSIISNIITPRAGTHSSITARDGNLLFWVIQRHRVNLPAVILERMIAAKDLQESLPYGSLLTMIFKKLSVDLSGDVPMSTKEKIGLITLRRSHYSLVGKKQNLWYKDSLPECEHEVYPDEPLSKLPNQLSLLKYHLKMLSFLPPPLFLSKMLPLRLYMKS